MQRKILRLKHGVAIARSEQAALIAQPLADMSQVKLECFGYLHEARDYMATHRPRVILLDYELCGAAGVFALAELMAEVDAPVILIVRDVSEWEQEQFRGLGVHAVLQSPFRISQLAAVVDTALKRRRRIGSSDRLPPVPV